MGLRRNSVPTGFTADKIPSASVFYKFGIKFMCSLRLKHMGFLLSTQTGIKFGILQAVTSHFHIASEIPTCFTEKAHTEGVRPLFIWQVKVFLADGTTSLCHITDFCMQSSAMSMLKIVITVHPPKIWFLKHSILWKQIKQIPLLNYSQVQMVVQ